MLLKLKAEALEDDYIAVMSFAITMLALMVAVITLCVTMLSEIGMPARWVLFLIYSVLLVYYFVTIKNKMRYFKNVNKWRQYRDFALKNKNPCSACEFQAKQGISILGIKLLLFSV